MGAVWWSALEAEHVTIEAEHRATRGDHYGTVQTACPLCVPAEPVAAGQLELEAPAHVCRSEPGSAEWTELALHGCRACELERRAELCEHLIPRSECRLVEHG